MKDNDQDSFWPGYVDAMSNMVLSLIFVVLVLALTLSLYSMVSAQRMAEQLYLSRITAPTEIEDGSLVETSDPTGLSVGGAEQGGGGNDVEGAPSEPQPEPEAVDFASLPSGIETTSQPTPDLPGLLSSEAEDASESELVGALGSPGDAEVSSDGLLDEPGSSPGQQDILELMLEELRLALSQLDSGFEEALEQGGGGSGQSEAGDPANAAGEASEPPDEKLRSALDFARRLRMILSEDATEEMPPLSVVEVAASAPTEADDEAPPDPEPDAESETQGGDTRAEVGLQASFLPASVEVEEDRSFDFAGETGLTIAGAASGEARVRLSVRNGTVAVDAVAGSDVAGSGTSMLSVSGPVELVDQTIKTLSYRGLPDFFGNDALTLLAEDASGAAITGTTQIEVLSVNDAPVAIESMVSAVEDMEYVFRQSDFQFEDTERNALAAVVIETLPAGGSLFYRGRAMEEATRVALEELQAGQLSFQPAGDANGENFSAFEFRVVDDGGTLNGGEDTSAASAGMTIDLMGTPDAPVGLLPQAIRVGEDRDYEFRGSETIAVNDADGNLIRVELSVGNGVITLAEDLAGRVTGNASGRVVVEGTQAEINAILASLTYRGNADFFGSDTLSLRAIDAENAAVMSAAAITVTPVNDAPVGQPSRIAVLEEVPYRLRVSDFGFRDIENDALAAVRIDTLPSVGRLEKDGEAISAGAVLTAEELVSGRLVYVLEPGEAEVGETSFDFTVSDDGGTEEGGEDTASAPARMTIEIATLAGAGLAEGTEGLGVEGEPEQVDAEAAAVMAAAEGLGDGTAANEAPTLDATRSYDLPPIREDLALEENVGIRVVDLVAEGVSDPQIGVGGTGIFVMSSGGIAGEWQARLDEASDWSAIELAQGEEEEAFLVARDAMLRFVPSADANGLATFVFGAWDESAGISGERVVLSERGGSSAYSQALATARIEVLAVNDAPVNLLPAPQSLAQDGVLVFGDALGNALVVNDLRDTSQPGATDFLETTLTVARGQLAPREGAVLEAEVVGAGTGRVTLSGKASAVNAALSGLSYRPPVTFAGSDPLTIVTRDFGNTGEGGELEARDVLEVVIQDRNDAPRLDSSRVYELAGIEEDLSLEANAGTRIGDLLGDGFRDPDAPDALGGIYVTALDDATGRWQARHGAAAEWRDITPAGEPGVAAYLIGPEDLLRFVPEPDVNGTSTLVFGAWDGSEGSAGAWVDLTVRGGASAYSEALATARVTIAAVNDAPENRVPSAQAIPQGETLVFGDAFGNPLLVSDARDTGQPGATDFLESVLEARDGILSPREGAEPAAEIVGAGTDRLSIRGSAEQVNAALSGLVYTPAADFSGSEEITLTTSDLGNTGLGGELVTTDRIDVTIEAVAAVVADLPEPETEAPVDEEEGNTDLERVQLAGDLQAGIVVSFPSQIVALDAEATLALQDMVSSFEGFRTAVLDLRVYSPSPNLSVERSASVTRGISVRQALLEAGVLPEGVRLMVVRDERSPEFAEVRIRLVGG